MSEPRLTLDEIKARQREEAEPKRPVADRDTPLQRRPMPEKIKDKVGALSKALADANPPKPATTSAQPSAAPPQAASPDAEEPSDGIYYSYMGMDRPEVRARIEARCEPMDFGSLVMSGRVQQAVEIMPGKVTVTFSTLTGREVFLLDTGAAAKHQHRQNQQTWRGYARLALSVVEVNSAAYGPRMLGEDYKPSLEAVDLLMDKLLQLPEPIIDMLLLNYKWFSARVQHLFEDDYEKLKNG